MDIHKSFSLSGEPLAPQIARWFDSLTPENPQQFTGSDIAATNIERRELNKEYMDYWNSTSSLTTSGRPVDAIISPLAPFPATLPMKYAYVGLSRWVNLVDYTAIVLPVTHVDKSIDLRDEGFVPSNVAEEIVHGSCKCLKSLQLLPR